MKSRKLAAALALLGAVTLPGIHRFYLGQPRWGLVYLLLAWKLPLSRIASLAEALWYLFLEDAAFEAGFDRPNSNSLKDSSPLSGVAIWGLGRLGRSPSVFLPVPERMSAAATALRELEQLRQEGLVSEAEFEQQRRSLLARPVNRRSHPLDANQASLEDWLTLPDLSIHQARRLTALRQQGVQFHSLEDVAAALNVTPGQLQPLAENLQFCYYEPPPEDGAAMQLDPNQASPPQLERLPGMTPELLQAWLQQRNLSPFRSLPDLGQRLELSAETTQMLMHYLKI